MSKLNGKWSFKKSQFANYVRKLRIQPNSVVLFKEGTITIDGLNELGKAIEQLKISGVILLMVKSVDDVRGLAELEMNRLGWFRVETLQKLLLRREADAAQHNQEVGEDRLLSTPDEPADKDME